MGNKDKLRKILIVAGALAASFITIVTTEVGLSSAFAQCTGANCGGGGASSCSSSSSSSASSQPNNSSSNSNPGG